MISRFRSGHGRAIVDSVGASLAIQGFVLISGIIAARVLGPTDRGYLALIWTVAFGVGQVGTLGLPLAVTYQLADGAITVRSGIRLLRRSIATQIAVATAVSAALLAVLTIVTSIPVAAAAVGVLVVPALILHSFALSAVQGAGHQRALNILRLLPVAGYALLLLPYAIRGDGPLLLVTLSWVASYLVAAGASSWRVARMARTPRPEAAGEVPPPTTEPSLKSMRRFGLRGLLGWVSPTETFRVDQLAVGLVLSAHSLGLYSVALAFTNLPRFFAQGIGLIAYPAVTRAGRGAPRTRAILGFTAVATACAVGTCGALALAAQPLVEIAFGDEYAGAVPVLRILLLATAFLCVRRILTDCVRGLGNAGAGSRAELVSWIILIPGVILGSSWGGLSGVAWGLAATYAMSLGFIVWLTILSLRRDGHVSRQPAVSV